MANDRKTAGVHIANDSASTSNLRVTLERLERSASTANLQALVASKPTSNAGSQQSGSSSSGAKPQGVEPTRK